MSLLNDMLRDLDRSAPEQEVGASGQGVTPLERRRRGGKAWWLSALAVLIFGYWLAAEKNYLGLLSTPPVHVAAPDAINIEPKWLTAFVEEALAEQPKTPRQPVSKSEHELSRVVAVPVVPVAEPLVPPVTRAPDSVPLERSETRAQPESADPLAESRPPTMKDQTRETSLAATPVAVKAERTTAKVSPPRQPTSQVSLSAEERDLAMAQALSARHLSQREAQAWQWLEEGAVIDLTALALADAYRALGDVNRLQELDRKLSARAPDLGAYVRAQQALLEDNRSGAVAALSNIHLPGRAESQRLRLLGGLYQSTQQYPQALEVYTALVSRRDAQANDWLGLAVALDSLGQRSSARDAYRSVHQLQHPDPKINAYAQRREYELSQSFLGR